MHLYFIISCIFTLAWSVEMQIQRKQSIELPYDDLASSVVPGVGYNTEQRTFMGSPFVTGTVVPHLSQNVSVKTEFTRRIIKDFKDYSEMLRDSAFVSFAGWGFHLRVDYYQSHKFHFTSYDALFVLKASKDMGFEGWGGAPAFTDDAKALLCSNLEEWQNIYGDYYLQGERKGAALQFYVKITTSTTHSEDKVSAGMSTGWSGFGIDASAGFNFSHAVNKSENISDVQMWAHTHGVDKDYMPSFVATNNHSIDGLQNMLDTFNAHSTQGAGIALVLKRYDDHPDYIAARTNPKCGLSSNTLTIEEYYVNLITGIAVQALLMASEIRDKAHEGHSCVTNLADQALSMFQEVADMPLAEVTPHAYSDIDGRFQDLYRQWDPVENTCAVLGFHQRKQRVGTCMETNVDYWHHDLKRVNHVESALACMEQCKGFFGCNAWTWTLDDGGYCWLKTSSEGRAIRMMLPFKISGPKTCTDCFERQYEYYGNDLGKADGVTNAQDCQEACKARRGCAAWTFKGKRKDKDEECFLKYSARGRQVTYEFPVMSGPSTCAQLETETCMAMGQVETECFGSVVTGDGYRMRMGTKYAFTNEDTLGGNYTWKCNNVPKYNIIPGSNLIEAEYSIKDMKLHWTGYECFPNEPSTPSFLELPSPITPFPCHAETCIFKAIECSIACTGKDGVKDLKCIACLGDAYNECSVCLENPSTNYLALKATGQRSPINLFTSAEGCCSAALSPQVIEKRCDEDCCAQLCQEREGCQGFQARLKTRRRGLRWNCKLYDTAPDLEANDDVCLRGKKNMEATCYTKME